MPTIELHDYVSEYCEFHGIQGEGHYYHEMIKKPQKRDNWMWEEFMEFINESL